MFYCTWIFPFNKSITVSWSGAHVYFCSNPDISSNRQSEWESVWVREREREGPREGEGERRGEGRPLLRGPDCLTHSIFSISQSHSVWGPRAQCTAAFMSDSSRGGKLLLLRCQPQELSTWRQPLSRSIINARSTRFYRGIYWQQSGI